MRVFETDVLSDVSEYFKNTLKENISLEDANKLLFDKSGIKEFFETNEELNELRSAIAESLSMVAEPDRAEYGDFQTNQELSVKVVQYIQSKGVNPEIAIEPTCGKGNFILASIKIYPELKKIYGIEIYKPYLWETKFTILSYFIKTCLKASTEIELIHSNVFDFDFSIFAKRYNGKSILLIGNPPWVTNSKLGSLSSENLPEKSNFKNHSGYDAITGKGNFDIGESVSLMLLKAFQNQNSYLAFLVKNAVIKNILFDQKNHSYRISQIEKHSIDSKLEFNVSVEASLFFCKLNEIPDYICNEFDFYNNKENTNRFGWINNKFVSDINHYKHSESIDGLCPFIWRQGVKHDCSAVMELEVNDNKLVNGLKQKVEIETELLYGLLKSSDLKENIISNTRKFTIITQHKVGQETTFIEAMYPKTYNYLVENKTYFDNRKSSIYKGKPNFSIFGIGDYSFKPYKVAISGLYKTYSFSLVLPDNEKPIMLDDTCYFIGFDSLDYAVYTYILLNSTLCYELLKSITFPDAKRTFTKDVLMRIDLLKLSTLIGKNDIEKSLTEINKQLNTKIDSWEEYLNSIQPKQSNQLGIFD